MIGIRAPHVDPRDDDDGEPHALPSQRLAEEARVSSRLDLQLGCGLGLPPSA